MLDQNIFEVEDNEFEFNQICSQLKCHPFSSPWKMFFKLKNEVDEHCSEVSEFVIDSSMDIDHSSSVNNSQNAPATVIGNIKNDIMLDEKKVNRLKQSILSAEDNTTVHDLKDVDIFFTISSDELPTLFSLLDVASLSEASVTLLLNTFLHYKDNISMTTATGLVSLIIYPIIFEMKKTSLRSLLTTILQFSEVYPKAVIDKMIIPYLRDKILDDQQLELFTQVSKDHLPIDYVAYCIKNILDNVQPGESSFSILQSLIERKVPHEKALYDQLLKSLLSWTQTCCNNVKFTKLLTSILSAYGSEFSQQQIQVCDEVIKANKTIIKKAAENLLKKLKQEI